MAGVTHVEGDVDATFIISPYLHGTGTGSDGSQIRFTSRGHFVLDNRTGQVGRDAITSTCRVS